MKKFRLENFKIEIQKGEGDQITQTFSKIDFHQKLGLPSLICRNFKTLTKLLLNHAACIEISSMTENLDLQHFSNWITEGGPNNSDFL